jgi:hypothetical protein
LDLHGNSLHQLGYAHPHVVAAMQNTLHELAFSPRRYTNRHAIELARRLCTAAPMDAAKLLLAHDLFDCVALPGDLEERLDIFSTVEMLELLYPLV